MRNTFTGGQIRYIGMKATTPSEMQDGILDARIESLIRQLPPEERAKISVQGNRYSGPEDLMRKLHSLSQREDDEGPAGD